MRKNVIFIVLLLFVAGVLHAQPFVDSGISLGPGLRYSHVEWGDYDNDGDLDVALMGLYNNYYTSATTRVMQNNGTGFSTGVNFSRRLFDGALDWGDYDNDGDLDLAVIGRRGSSAYEGRIYRNDGWGFTDIGMSIAGSRKAGIDWGDYDNDGDLDLAVHGENSSWIYRNDEGLFTTVYALPNSIGSASVQFGDYDNDGDLDVLLLGIGIKVFNNNAGAFTLVFSFRTNVSMRGEAKWGDLDGDGDLDIVYAGVYSGILRNDNGSFTDLTGLVAAGNGSCDLGDYDNDGDLDILLAGSGECRIYRNDNGTSFVQIATSLPGLYDGSVAWGDYDNDGDLDILLTGAESNGTRHAKIYRNDNSATNMPPALPGGLQADQEESFVRLSWNRPADDRTAGSSLTYNFRYRFMNTWYNAWHADTATGYRKIADYGNAQLDTSAWIPLDKLLNQADAYCYDTLQEDLVWEVQAVDNGFAGSGFARDTLVLTRVLNPPVITGTNSDTTVCAGEEVVYVAARSYVHSGDFNVSVSSGSRVVFDSAALMLSTRPRTVSMWIKTGAVSATQYIFAINTSANDKVALLGVGPDGRLIYDDGGEKKGNTVIADTAWHHIAYSFDGALVKLYIDGGLDAVFSSGAAVSSTDKFTLGNTSNGSQSSAFKGIIAEFVVWNTNLTADEISYYRENAPAPGSPRYDDLVVYYPFIKECGTNTLLDYSPNGIHGSVTDLKFLLNDRLPGYDNIHYWDIEWRLQGGGLIADTDTARITPASSGVYYFRARFGRMLLLDTFQVAVNPLPSLTLTDTTICAGDSVVLDAGSFSSYAWSTGAVTRTIMVSEAGVYTVRVTDSNNCSTTDSVMVSHFAVVTPDLGDSLYFCNGDSIAIDAGNFNSFLWNTGATTRTLTVSAPGVYSVRVTDGNNCSTADSVVVNHFPVTTPDLGDSLSFCAGGSAVIDAGLFSSYLWSTGAVTRTITVTEPGLYSVEITDANGCRGSASVAVDTLALPVVVLGADETVCLGEQYLLSPVIQGNGPFTYRWQDNSNASLQVVNTWETGTGEHRYAVTVTDRYGCQGVDAMLLTVKICVVGLDTPDSGIKIYPNPVRDRFTLYNPGRERMQIVLLDSDGRVIYSGYHEEGEVGFSLQEEPSGLYLLKINTSTGRETHKIIKQE